MTDSNVSFIDFGGAHARIDPKRAKLELFTGRDCSTEHPIEPQHIIIHGRDHLAALADAIAPWATPDPEKAQALKSLEIQCEGSAYATRRFGEAMAVSGHLAFALKSLMALARPHFSDDTQAEAIADAELALSRAANLSNS
jgi:hypothetical protein